MAICGKCGNVESVEEIRRCYSALPTAEVEFRTPARGERADLSLGEEIGSVSDRGENFFLGQSNIHMHNVHRDSFSRDEEWMKETSSQAYPLRVPYEEKDEAKSLGAKWSTVNRVWYVPPGGDISLFRKWDPKIPKEQPQTTHSETTGAHGSGTRRQDTSTFPAPARSLVEDGFYWYGGTVVRVVHNQAETGQYASALRINQETGKGVWTYAPGVMSYLTDEDRLTEEQASEFGKLYGICGICGRKLTNPESIDRGIGPICAGKI